MALTKSYNFTNSNDYSFDSNSVEVSNGARLKLLIEQKSAVETFDNSAGFTFNPVKSEITAGSLRQKDTRPTKATFYAKFNNSIIGNWGDGSLNSTGVVGATISNNSLTFHGVTGERVDFDGYGNGSTNPQTGTVRLKVTPHYSGNPSGSQIFFGIAKETGNPQNINLTMVLQSTNGNIMFILRDSAGGNHDVSVGSWSPVAGQEYEFEFNWDNVIGSQKLFIDGVLFGSATQTYTRTNDIHIIRFGGGMNGDKAPDFSIKDFLIFNAVQHTADYIPDWSNIYETIYREDVITFPQQSEFFLNEGFTGFQDVEVGTQVKYTLNGFWWNGSVWQVADGTLAQSNTPTEINSHISLLQASQTVDVKAFTQNSNLQSSVETITTSYQINKYTTTPQNISPFVGLRSDQLFKFLTTQTINANTQIYFTLDVDGTQKYYDGSAWVDSDGTIAQSNTISVLTDTVIQDLDIQLGANIIPIVKLVSTDGKNTPEITNLSINYDFWAEPPTGTNKCYVYGYIENAQGVPAQSVKITAQLNTSAKDVNGQILSVNVFETTTNINGYFELLLANTEELTAIEGNDKVRYIFNIYLTPEPIKKILQVPNKASEEFTNLTE